jgi:hypothetical protein
MKEVPLCNVAIASNITSQEIESLISAIELASAKVQKEANRVVGVDDVVTVITILVGVGQLTEYSIRIAKAIIKWRKQAREKGIQPAGKLEHPSRPPLDLSEASDEEIEQWFRE